MLRIKEDKAVADLEERLEAVLDYSIALQRAIECHCQEEEVRPHIAEKCDHHAQMLNKSLRGHAGADTADMPELARRIEELEGRLAFLTARHNRIAEPTAQERAELACRIKKVERGMKQYAKVEGSRLVAYEDLCRRIEELDEAALELARYIKELRGRIEQLERLLEREAKNNDYQD